MPGYELINKEEKLAVNELFKEGGVLFAHGFEKLRKKFSPYASIACWYLWRKVDSKIIQY